MTDLVPATGDYLEQILRDTYPLWTDGLAPDQYARFWEAQLRTSWGSAHLDRVALVESGRVVCSAKRYALSARIEGRIRRVVGIGAVFTAPEKRGFGLAQRLLDTLLETAEAEGFDTRCSSLRSIRRSINGSISCQFLYSSRAWKCSVKGGSPAVLVRAGEDRDIPSVAEMSARRAEGARLALDRSEDWIRYGLAKRRLLAGLGPAGLREIEFLVTEEGHQAVAYLVSMVYGGRWYIEDAGDRDPSGARLGAMLQAMIARTPHLPAPEIRAWLPPDFTPPQVTRVETKPTAGVMMIRPLKDRSLPLPPLDASQVSYCRLDYF